MRAARRQRIGDRLADAAARPGDERHLASQFLTQFAHIVRQPVRTAAKIDPPAHARRKDRKSVVSGKSVSVRVELGGRCIITKKKSSTRHIQTNTPLQETQ